MQSLHTLPPGTLVGFVDDAQDENGFVPVVMEINEGGTPFLPAFSVVGYKATEPTHADAAKALAQDPAIAYVVC